MSESGRNIAEMVMQDCAQSYPAMFNDRVVKTPNKIAFTVPTEDGYRQISWAQAKRDVDLVAAGLLALGLEAEERVAIACTTRYEWVMADLGIASAGGATTTVYPNTNAKEEFFILQDSGSVMIFVENAGQLGKVLSDREASEQLRAIILIDDDREPHKLADHRVLTLRQLKWIGHKKLESEPDCVTERIAQLTPDSLSTLIYTSGTTGSPKGVELLHKAWVYEGEAMKRMDFATPDDVLYLWLPLAHVFGRDLLACQITIGFRSVVDGRVDQILAGLGETKPTILVGVPRIFEKIRAAVMTMYPANGVKGRISRWAFAAGRKAIELEKAGGRPSWWLNTKLRIADRLVFSKLRAKLGGRMRFMISGSAKLSRQVQEWFARADISIFEGYGSTETAAIAFVNHPDRVKFGTVGQLIPGLEVKIAEDGEILIKGPTIARGYHNLPAESAESFIDGWYHTGDIGSLDAEGYLTITDRKKDLFKTSNGKYVAPQKVENAIMAIIPYVSQAVVIGNERKFVTVLVALEPVALAKWAARRGKEDLSYAELTQLPEIGKSLDRFMRKVNAKLERWEQIKYYRVLPQELSLDQGTLTASLKIRRHQVGEIYHELIEQMYDSDEPSNIVVP